MSKVIFHYFYIDLNLDYNNNRIEFCCDLSFCKIFGKVLNKSFVVLFYIYNNKSCYQSTFDLFYCNYNNYFYDMLKYKSTKWVWVM